MPKKYDTIFLDQDGVLTKFAKNAVEVTNKHMKKTGGPTVTTKEMVEKADWNMPGLWGLTDEEWWEILDAEENFWLNLEPFDWAEKLYKKLQKQTNDLIILTAPPESNTTACSQKRQWLKKHLGIESEDVIVGKRKYALSRPGTLLIDDNAKNVRSFIGVDRPSGNAVVVPSDWNTADLTFEAVWKEIEKAL